MATMPRQLSLQSKRFSLSTAPTVQTNEARIREALEEVERTFPFDNYLFDMAPHMFVARLIYGRLLPKGGRILDLGGGACDKAAVLARLGYECEVWDDLKDPWHRAGENVEIIKHYARCMGVVLRERNVGESAFEQESFDLVMLIDVVEHLHESPRYMLNAAIRSLRKEGILLVVTPNSANLRKRIAVLLGGTNHTPAREFFDSSGRWRGHVREWTKSETVHLLRWMGLVEIRRKTFHGLLGQRVSSPTLCLLYRVLAAPFPWGWDTICAWGKKPSTWTPVKAPANPAPAFPLRLPSNITQQHQEKIYG
jgi:2-polyprenyl-3-methyl-5-hydroxy-6-metoxy-1,4-benzoquinol methylase